MKITEDDLAPWIIRTYGHNVQYYIEGFNAARLGVKLSNNPYREHILEEEEPHSIWAAGYFGGLSNN